MKILHTADIHLGVVNGKLPIEKQTVFRNNRNISIEILFNEAIKEDYDVVLICGDLFHLKNVPSKTIRIFFNNVESFNRPVLYIKGNHDEKFDFDIEMPSNFIILDEESPFYKLDNTVFWGPKSKEALKENYNKDNKNILLLHGELRNQSDNDYININDYIEDYFFDYIALGHVHSFEKIQLGNSWAVYPGSLFSNGFDESGIKGYVQVTLDKDLSIEYVPFISTGYKICECDITGFNSYNDLLTRARNAVDEKCSLNDMVRLVLKGYYTEDNNKYLDNLKRDFSDYFYFEIVDNSKLFIDFDKLKNERLSFKAEFLKLVEENEDDEIIRNKIWQLGIEALRGDDISI